VNTAARSFHSNSQFSTSNSRASPLCSSSAAGAGNESHQHLVTGCARPLEGSGCMSYAPFPIHNLPPPLLLLNAARPHCSDSDSNSVSIMPRRANYKLHVSSCPRLVHRTFLSSDTVLEVNINLGGQKPTPNGQSTTMRGILVVESVI